MMSPYSITRIKSIITQIETHFYFLIWSAGKKELMFVDQLLFPYARTEEEMETRFGPLKSSQNTIRWSSTE